MCVCRYILYIYTYIIYICAYVDTYDTCVCVYMRMCACVTINLTQLRMYYIYTCVLYIYVCICVCVSACRSTAGRRKPIRCLILISHFPPNSPIISGSFAKRDLKRVYACRCECMSTFAIANVYMVLF